MRKRSARRRAGGTRAPILGDANCPRVDEFVHDQFTGCLFLDPEYRLHCDAEVPVRAPRHLDRGMVVAGELTARINRHDKQGMIVSDNGLEFTSNAMLAWSTENNIDWHVSAPDGAERLSQELAAGCTTSTVHEPRIELR